MAAAQRYARCRYCGTAHCLTPPGFAPPAHRFCRRYDLLSDRGRRDADARLQRVANSHGFGSLEYLVESSSVNHTVQLWRCPACRTEQTVQGSLVSRRATTRAFPWIVLMLLLITAFIFVWLKR